MNRLPSKDRLSDDLSPSTIVEGGPKVNMVHWKVYFGSYAMIYIGTMNKIKSRYVPDIAINLSNISGRYFFMKIFTGKRMHRYNWKSLPIIEEII